MTHADYLYRAAGIRRAYFTGLITADTLQLRLLALVREHASRYPDPAAPSAVTDGADHSQP